VAPGAYGVLVSEIMLQQTQVSRVLPAWERFMAQFPTVAALAGAPIADVVRAWAGLGYNRRAAALWKAAGMIVAEHGGRVPSDVVALRRLPGVGAYTAAAVASCAYAVPVAAVDTNVRRVVSRARLGREPGAGAEVEVERAAQVWLDRSDPGAWNQAVMDLGREVCRPRPLCQACPLAKGCPLRAAGPVGPAGGVRGAGVRESARAQPFEGSFRQLRGRIIAMLREVPSASLGQMARRWGEPTGRVSAAVTALSAEGLVHASPAALDGSVTGRVRLGS
jgi:A/G-specific adenine glycosylase